MSDPALARLEVLIRQLQGRMFSVTLAVPVGWSTVGVPIGSRAVAPAAFVPGVSGAAGSSIPGLHGMGATQFTADVAINSTVAQTVTVSVVLPEG